MTDYNALKVTELKDLVKERGIQLNGAKRKAEYVEALEAQDKENGGEGGDAGAETGAADVDAKVEDAPKEEADADMQDAESDGAEDRKRKREAMEDVDEAASKKTRTEEQADEPRSEHRPTAALYIKNLSRPLQVAQFRSELSALVGADEDAITDMHLDALKTHAFVVCSSPATASSIRTAIHGKPWPQSESTRKDLYVDYVPEDSVRDWIDQENTASRDARFEVTYSQDQYGSTVAELVDLNARSAAPQQQEYDTQPQDETMADEPERPRAPANKLDELYSYTDAKPKIYFQPVKQELADQRLDELERETARDWDKGDAWNRTTRLAPIDQLRRYTFDDGFKVVDGGVDFGGFGRRQGAGGTGGGGAGNGPRRYRP